MGNALRRILVALLAAGAIVVGVVVGAAVLAVVVVTTTQLGARQALRLGARLVPGELSIGAIDGTVYSGLGLGDVRYRNETVDVRFDELVVEPRLRELVRGRWVLERLRVANGRIEIVEPEPTRPPTAAPEADARRAAAPKPAGDDDARGLLPDIPRNVEVRDLVVADVVLDGLGTPIRVDTLSGSVRGESIELDRIVVDGAGATFDLSGAARVETERATGELTGSVRLPQERPAPDSEPGSTESIELDLTFAFDDGADEDWRASLDWSWLAWRGRTDARPSSPNGTLVVEPRADGAFDVDLDASIEGDPLPSPAALTASAVVSANVIEVDEARLAIADAAARGTGAFELGSRSGYVSVDYRGIDPAALLRSPAEGDLHGRIDVAIAVAPVVRVGGSGRIEGELGGRPLDGELVATYVDDTLAIERGEVSLDGGRIVLDGMLAADSADLRFSASLPHLDNWYPPLTGALAAQGTIAGDPDNPRVDIDVEGEDLAWEGLEMPPLERVALRVDGTRAAHGLRLEAESALGRVLLEADQHYAEGAVDGRLTESVLESRDAGAWRLAEPAAYSASTAELELGPACFAGPEDARLCTSAKGPEVIVSARAVPNALAEPWLPDRFVVGGTTYADAEVLLGRPLEASLTLRHDALRIGVESAGAAPSLLDLADVTLRATLDGDALAVELWNSEREAPADAADASLLTPSSLEGRLTLSPPAADGRLDAFASAQLTELGLLGELIDGIDGLSGAVDARIAVRGTPASPRVSGIVDASRLAAELPALGIDVTDGRLSAALDEIGDLESVPFEAALCSEGCARLAGRLSLPQDDDWTLTASVEGEDVLIADLPMVRAVATPRLEIRATPALAMVTGSVAFSEASVEIEDVPRSAVRPVPETVVHGRETPEDVQDRLPIPLSMDLEATLGNVRFEGLGVEAQLDGTLDVERMTDGDWLVQGRTTIEEGTFTAYGQTLAIERGLLVFTGPPDNPELDIRVTRTVGDTEVGLTITGTAENPRSEVMSGEGISASEAFAQLLTGRSLGDLDESDPEALERAAIGLGIRRALPTLGRIGAALGLDELGVDAPGDVEGAVVAARQIGDDLYLRYWHGLFEDISGLELIYRISDRLRLRTQTGTAQSIDLIYEVDPGAPDTLAEDVQDIDVAIRDELENPAAVGPELDAR